MSRHRRPRRLVATIFAREVPRSTAALVAEIVTGGPADHCWTASQTLRQSSLYRFQLRCSHTSTPHLPAVPLWSTLCLFPFPFLLRHPGRIFLLQPGDTATRNTTQRGGIELAAHRRAAAATMTMTSAAPPPPPQAFASQQQPQQPQPQHNHQQQQQQQRHQQQQQQQEQQQQQQQHQQQHQSHQPQQRANPAIPPSSPGGSQLQSALSPPSKRDLKSWWKGFKLPSKQQESHGTAAPLLRTLLHNLYLGPLRRDLPFLPWRTRTVVLISPPPSQLVALSRGIVSEEKQGAAH